MPRASPLAVDAGRVHNRCALRSLRATEQQRNRAVERLGEAYREGMLSTGTLELRVEAALRVRTRQQLEWLIEDLPTLRSLPSAARTALAKLRPPAGPPTAGAVNLALPQGGAGTRMMIGRDTHCDVVFAASSVSRRHALIRRQATGWVLHDLGSLNGTWVNGRRVEHAGVAPGDQASFGCLVATLI